MSAPGPLRIVFFASASCAPAIVRELRAVAELVRMSRGTDVLNELHDGARLLVADDLHWDMLTDAERQQLSQLRCAGQVKVMLLTAYRPKSFSRDLADVDILLRAGEAPAAVATSIHRLLRAHGLLQTLSPSATSPAHRSALAARQILLVDDSELSNRITAALLGDAGCTVLCITDPFDMRRHIREHNPDLVLVDYNMPALRGDHLIWINRRTGLSVPMLLYSNAADDVLDAAAQRCGAIGYIRKGEPADLLLSRIAASLPVSAPSAVSAGAAPSKSSGSSESSS